METLTKCDNSVGAKEGDQVVIEVHDPSKEINPISYLLPMVILILSFGALYTFFGDQYTIGIGIASAVLALMTKLTVDRVLKGQKKDLPEMEEFHKNKILRILDHSNH